MIKRLEQIGKKLLKKLIKIFLPEPNRTILPLDQIRKVLVFRLDQRIGNGIMLLPLLRAISESVPTAEVHLLVHHPIALFFEQNYSEKLSKIWAYDQKHLLRNPFRMLKLLNELKQEEFNVVISCHNPDNFSLSQALFGRWIKPKRLVGFRWKDSEMFYDIAVASDTQKHYTDALLDLWRAFDSQAGLKWGGIKIPSTAKKEMIEKFPQLKEKPIIFWLGATQGKELPISLITFIYQTLQDNFQIPVLFATGPADKELYHHLPSWIRHQLVVLKTPLTETAAFFSCCRLFISGDTGPMHLSVAIGVPTLTIFIHTNKIQYGYDDQKKHFAFQFDDTPKNILQLKQLLFQIVFQLHLDEKND